jgi:excisionase family DNA binding protein
MLAVLNKTAAAKVLGISTETLDRYKKNGKLPHHKIGDRILFTESDLTAFLDACAISATAKLSEREKKWPKLLLQKLPTRMFMSMKARFIFHAGPDYASCSRGYLFNSKRRLTMKIPQQILSMFEKESSDLKYGQVSITALFREGKARFLVDKQQSIHLGNETEEFIASADLFAKEVQ